MTDPALARGDAFRMADDEIEVFRAKNARAKKAQAAREAEQAEQDKTLQPNLKADFYRRNPHLRDEAA
jgi:hypothetical protein